MPGKWGPIARASNAIRTKPPDAGRERTINLQKHGEHECGAGAVPFAIETDERGVVMPRRRPADRRSAKMGHRYSGMEDHAPSTAPYAQAPIDILPVQTQALGEQTGRREEIAPRHEAAARDPVHVEGFGGAAGSRLGYLLPVEKPA